MDYLDKLFDDLAEFSCVSSNTAIIAQKCITVFIKSDKCPIKHFCCYPTYLDMSPFNIMRLPTGVKNVLKHYYKVNADDGNTPAPMCYPTARFDLCTKVSHPLKEDNSMNVNQRLQHDEKLLHKVQKDIHKICNQQKHS